MSKSNSTFEQLLDVPFTFHERRAPISCKIRPAWRIYTLLMILDKCHGGKANLIQLHVLNWAIRTRETRRAFHEFLNGERSPSQTIVRHDPSLNRAVHFAFAEKLVTRQEVQQTIEGQSSKVPPYRVVLSDKGRRFVKRLKALDGCFETQKQFLDSIPGKIAQKDVNMLFSWGE